jgi:hypothetical protein
VLVVVAVCLNITGQSAPAVSALSELRDKERALLVVYKSRVVDVTGNERAIIDDVLKADPDSRKRYSWVYNQIAGKLNKYIRKHQSMSSARTLAEADYVIFFNLVEYRRILNAYYPYGELFVIVKGAPQDQKPPRIVWRARKMLVATDAIGDLIKDLMTLRGEG